MLHCKTWPQVLAFRKKWISRPIRILNRFERSEAVERLERLELAAA